jgi:succinoglycan biosynthesis protein ExoO
LEIVVVDDKSTDNTAEVVAAMAADEPRIRLVKLPANLGAAGARNAGLECARGEWIAVLDADDAYAAGRLAALLATARTSNADLVADNFLYYNAQTKEIGDCALATAPPHEVVDRYRFVERSHGFSDESDWGMLKPMFRRRFLQAHGLRYRPYARHGQDFLFVLDILLAGGRYVLNRTPYYIWTTRDSGMSRTPVNYDKMAVQNAQLLEDDRIQSDPAMRRLIVRRVHAIERMSAERKMSAMIANRKLGAALTLAASNRWAARALVRRIVRRTTSVARWPLPPSVAIANENN